MGEGRRESNKSTRLRDGVKGGEAALQCRDPLHRGASKYARQGGVSRQGRLTPLSTLKSENTPKKTAAEGQRAQAEQVSEANQSSASGATVAPYT